MIAAIHSGWCGGGSVTAPSGWTLLNETINTGTGCGSSNTNISLSTFFKMATASEPASYTFVGSGSQPYVGGIVAYGNVNSTYPILTTSNFGAQDSCASIIAQSINNTSPCVRLVGVFICSVNSWATNIVPPSGMTERFDVGTTGNNPWGNENVELADEQITAIGPTGNRIAYLTGCSSDGWITGGQLIAVNCAASPTSIEQSNLLNTFQITPNPSIGILYINSTEHAAKNYTIEVYDAFGKRVYQNLCTTNKATIDLQSLPKGVYILKIISSKQCVSKSIVLE